MVSAWKGTFPRSARPSSRAAFLFSYDGDALPRSTFEQVLSDTEELLAEHDDGPFFCGAQPSAADVAWAPFLERYAAQLPCLHDSLTPRATDGSYPRLSAWFDAMEALPAYACRVEGDAASWRKVLSMAGYGNAGTPTRVLGRMDEAAAIEAYGGAQRVSQPIWAEFAQGRAYVAPTAAAEAAATIVRNRDDILADAAKRNALADGVDADAALRAVACLLASTAAAAAAEEVEEVDDEEAMRLGCSSTAGVSQMASFLDARMCVPRDMGAPCAAELKSLAAKLSENAPPAAE